MNYGTCFPFFVRHISCVVYGVALRLAFLAFCSSEGSSFQTCACLLPHLKPALLAFRHRFRSGWLLKHGWFANLLSSQGRISHLSFLFGPLSMLRQSFARNRPVTVCSYLVLRAEFLPEQPTIRKFCSVSCTNKTYTSFEASQERCLLQKPARCLFEIVLSCKSLWASRWLLMFQLQGHPPHKASTWPGYRCPFVCILSGACPDVSGKQAWAEEHEDFVRLHLDMLCGWL